jgi:hypothetical protein
MIRFLHSRYSDAISLRDPSARKMSRMFPQVEKRLPKVVNVNVNVNGIVCIVPIVALTMNVAKLCNPSRVHLTRCDYVNGEKRNASPIRAQAVLLQHRYGRPSSADSAK